jgi:hypothetical protein
MIGEVSTLFGACSALKVGFRKLEDALDGRGVLRKRILPDADQLGIPLGRDALASDGLAQDALGLPATKAGA